jgi:hypothetical protein
MGYIGRTAVVLRGMVLLCAVCVTAPAVAQQYGDFTYTVTSNSTVTITGYFGLGGDIIIPSSIHGNSVTAIGSGAFSWSVDLSSVTIPASVTSIGQQAFSGSYSLTNVTVDPANAVYSSIDGVLFSKAQTSLIRYGAGRNGDYLIPDGVTTIGRSAFSYCDGLTSTWFLGNAPTLPQAESNVFFYSAMQVVYYRAGTTGWGSTYAGVPTFKTTASTPEMIPHDWLLGNYPTLSTDQDFENAALQDTDADGMLAWEEYVAGTSPTNEQDYFQVSSITTHSNQSGLIQWDSVSNRLYSVYCHTNLLTDWPSTSIYQVHGDGTPKVYTNTISAAQCFFRLGVEVSPQGQF